MERAQARAAHGFSLHELKLNQGQPRAHYYLQPGKRFFLFGPGPGRSRSARRQSRRCGRPGWWDPRAFPSPSFCHTHSNPKPMQAHDKPAHAAGGRALLSVETAAHVILPGSGQSRCIRVDVPAAQGLGPGQGHKRRRRPRARCHTAVLIPPLLSRLVAAQGGGPALARAAGRLTPCTARTPSEAGEPAA